LAYGNVNVVSIGSTLFALEIQAAQNWWHIREGAYLYEEEVKWF